MFLKSHIILLQISLKFDAWKTIGGFDLAPKDRDCASALHKGEVMILNDQYLFCFNVIASIAFIINAPCKALRASSLDRSPAYKYNCQL